MTSKLSERRASLRLVSPTPRTHEAEVTEFYDRTITAAWRLATALHPDPRRASDAVIEAYRTVWFAGARDQATLLHALVVSATTVDDPVPA